MEKCKPIKTPMYTNGHLDLDEGGNPVDQTLYHSMIGSLLYLTASRPDIMFSVCMFARFQANPKKAHLRAVKRILRYLKHTPSVGLWYPKGATFDLISYSNSDYAGCKIDRKSTSGGCHLLGRSLVSWTSCRCFGSDRTPGVAPQGLFRSRTVLPTVAQWFVQGARETVDNGVQVQVALRCVTPYVLARMLYVVDYKGAL
jgi:hypothetical protein